jgi:hypothetical protein
MAFIPIIAHVSFSSLFSGPLKLAYSNFYAKCCTQKGQNTVKGKCVLAVLSSLSKILYSFSSNEFENGKKYSKCAIAEFLLMCVCLQLAQVALLT